VATTTTTASTVATTTAATTTAHAPGDPIADLRLGGYHSESEILELRDGLAAYGAEGLRVRLDAEPALWGKLAEFEQEYANLAGASIIVTAAPGVDAEILPVQVAQAGALLSAGQGDSLELRFQPVAETIPFEYQNVQVDIDLYRLGTGSKASLLAPIMITMPIPDGLQAEGLGIRHYYDSNLATYEEITPEVSGRYATFTVSRFSPFVFYNRGLAASPGNSGWASPPPWHYYNPYAGTYLYADPDAYSPKTGDNSMAAVYGIMTAASLLLAGVVALKAAKGRRQN
jgi:hypothetical protein